ncbi:MAG TPA: NAD(P)-dependent oxidoreductase [Solirubrobacteraceae bacterium]|nr:NAD(P)-dependent oxidoreductase [Solirubrobacteraceae bacterium]
MRAAVPREDLETIAARAPAAEVIAIDELSDLSELDFVVPVPDGRAEFAERLSGLERLAVVQTLSAGVDNLQGRIPEHVTLCSARGARDDTVAEWVLGALLGACTRLLESCGARTWEREERDSDLYGSTVLIVGMGSIGRRVGELVSAFGATPVGVVSAARDGLRGVEELHALLGAADAVVLLTPLTDATRGLFDAGALARMRDGALLVNAARGAVVDTDALVAETASGRLRAVLDVTDPEPLPDGHPLWEAEGVLSITPHIAGDSPRAARLSAELAGDQLARFCAGEPLRGVVQQGSRSRLRSADGER